MHMHNSNSDLERQGRQCSDTLECSSVIAGLRRSTGHVGMLKPSIYCILAHSDKGLGGIEDWGHD